ncbi:MAG: N-acetylmuramoyl-L-alanine amidase [Chloroflexi bacterium]|nr:MAG: N-acetylmuramoyl-L-alanine amidase [Chloroflexota bacterium]TMF27454.1 MAG: N-acetylmuramoyl-L-alanine amidase [Chloroflexota bacterium]
MIRLLGGVAALAAVVVAVVLVANAAVSGAVVTRAVTAAVDPGFVPAGAPLGQIGTDPGDPDDPWSAAAPPGGVILQTPGPSASPGAIGTLRVPLPKNIPIGPRRVGIQVGHWKTDEAPPELTKLVVQTGASWEGVNEVDLNLDIAQRVAVLLNSSGIAVDILPTTIPPGYLADAVVALHADSDGVGELSGFKMAHSARRGPYEDALLNDVKTAYAKATGLDYDGTHISNAMRGYYVFSWTRFQHAVSPFTPGVILEMGYLSNDDDRALMIDKADVVAAAISAGIMRFLSDTPRAKIFEKELVVPAFPSRGPLPTSTP